MSRTLARLILAAIAGAVVVAGLVTQVGGHDDGGLVLKGPLKAAHPLLLEFVDVLLGLGIIASVCLAIVLISFALVVLFDAAFGGNS